MKKNEKAIKKVLDSLKAKNKVDDYRIEKRKDFGNMKCIGTKMHFDYVVSVSVNGDVFGLTLNDRQVSKICKEDGIEGLEDTIETSLSAYLSMGKTILDIVFNKEYESAKENLFVRVRRVDDIMNPEDLIMRKNGDMALVLYFDTGKGSGLCGSVAVDRMISAPWEKTDDELLDWGLKNSLDKYPLTNYHMTMVFSDEDEVTTVGRVMCDGWPNGAIAAFSPDYLERIARLCNSDYYCVIPSDEYMVYFATGSNQLQIIRYFLENLETEMENGVLSDDVYYYDAVEKTLEVIPEHPESLS